MYLWLRCTVPGVIVSASLIILTMHCPEVFATELICSLCQIVLKMLGYWQADP